ncbi:MAG: hypothetical protein VYE22_40140 [Myxococcota bacterium]|nr:hypothetical protein [Myxococcota bacterium]
MACALTACGEPTPPPSDSGLDAGTEMDSGALDGGRDGGWDASDAASDGGSDPNWLHVTALPAACRVEFARDPAAALPPLQFEPCPGEAGCRQVVVDWPWASADLGPLYLQEQSAADDLHSYFTWSRPVRLPAGWWIYTTVARDDGTPLLTLRYPVDEDRDDVCRAGNFGLTPSTFAFAFVHIRGDEIASYPVRARFDQPLESWVLADERPSLGYPIVGKVWTTDERSVLDTSGTDWIMEADGSLVVLDLPSFAGIDMMQDDVIYASELRADGWHVVRFLPGQATSEVLIAPNTDGEAAMFRRHGDVVTWHRLIGRITGTRYERAELWTGRMVDEGVASPRRVAELELPTYRGSSQQRFGWVWEIETLERFALYGTRSDVEREYTAPADRIVPSQPVLGPTEIGVPVGYRPATRGLETIRFYEYEALPVAASE